MSALFDHINSPDFMATLQINDRINCTKFYIKVLLSNSGLDLKNDIECEQNNLSADSIRLVFSGNLLNDYFSLSHQGIKHGSVIFLIPKKVSSRRITPSAQMMRLSELIDRYYSLISGKFSKSSLGSFSKSSLSPKTYKEPIQTNDLRSIVNEISEIISNPIVKASARIYSEFQMKIEEAYEIVQSSNTLQNGLFGNNIYFSSLAQKSVLFAARTHDIAFDQVESTPEGFRLLQSIVKDFEQSSNGPIDSSDSSFFASGLHSSAISSPSSWYGKNKQKTNINYKAEISTKPLPQCWCRPSSLASNSPTYFMSSKSPLLMTRTTMPSNKSSLKSSNFLFSPSKYDIDQSQRKSDNQQSNILNDSSPTQSHTSIDIQSPSKFTEKNIEKDGNINDDGTPTTVIRSLSDSQSKINKLTNSSSSAVAASSPAIYEITLGLSDVNVSHKPKEISNKSCQSDDDKCSVSTDDDAKEKFAMQLDTLKSMGFHDEETILRALMEADGNVQLAARILKQNPMSSVK